MSLKPYFRYLVIVLIALGVVLRFTNLEQKFYWVDEVFTSLRISGYLEQDIGSALYQKSLFTAQDLQLYQYPNLEKNTIDTISGLAKQEPQLPPLYFVFARFWVQLFGSSEAVTRSASAVVSLLVFPGIYWLCLELFESSTTAWIAIALVAVSPFHVVYAQEARPYSLWMAVTVWCSWAFLRAIRLPTRRHWGLYATMMALSFYTFLYSMFVAAGHGIYLLIREKFCINQIIQRYLLASLIAVVLFIPWLIVLLKNWQNTSTYTGWQSLSLEYGIPELLMTWGLNVTRLFVDFDLSYGFSFTNPFPYLLIVLVTVGFVVYTITFLCRTTELKTWLFIVTLIGTTGLAIALPDLLFGGQRSATGRYFVPSYLGIQLAVAYFFASKITSSLQHQKLWRWLVVAVFSIGLLSCLNYLPARTWWNKAEGGYVPAVADAINSAPNPLVVNELDFWLFSLSHSLDPDTQLFIVDSRVGVPALPSGYSDYFLFNSSEELITRLKQQGHSIESIPDLEAAPLLRLQ
ncbi:MAG: hypothetical protein Kow00121_63680 [Elainellaceae cyanobacterium]